MRAPEDIEVELMELKRTYIGNHILRTIHNGLTIPNISYDWKKGIQLLRHTKSRKRSCLFSDDKIKVKQPFAREEEDVADILCAAQMKNLIGANSNTRMDSHLKDVRYQQREIFDMIEGLRGARSKMEPIPENTYTVSSSTKLLAQIKQNVEELEKKFSNNLKRSNSQTRNSLEVDKKQLYAGLTSDQRDAGDYFLTKICSRADDDQLLMLLHGQPGSGKTFFIERIRDYTNLRMKITASSGLAGMSLGGTTLDWLMGFGYCSTSTINLETLKSRLKGTELLIIDEISMIGCRKLIRVDALLKKVFNDTRPFGGLHVLLVGDFAQLPAVRQISLVDTMVNSTKMHTDHSTLEIQVEALFGLFKKFELRGFQRSKDCKKLRKLLKKFRDYENSEPTLSEDDLRRIGVLNKRILKKDPEFRDASILVTTRKERDSINKRSGCEWARKQGVPVYWWYQRSTRTMEDTVEADHYAHSMSKFCCGVRAFYIPGASCMLKANPFPAEGYANGSQGRMIGIVHDENDYVLPEGSPGEMIMIPPPRFIIMEVHHKGKVKKTSIFPCEKQQTVLEYKRDGKDCSYRCWSNMVVLTFALTIHETQGQTLSRIILLLGRLPGMCVGRITWSLLYVALSRTKKLSHIKFFPTGSSRYYHSMYFAHLLKLSMPANLKKWQRSYVDHSWDRSILRNEHLASVKKVEKQLKRLGKDKTKRLKWSELQSLVKRMGRKTTTRDRKMILFYKLKEHMVKQLIWKPSKDPESSSRKADRCRIRKRTTYEAEVENYQESKSSVRQRKRLRVSKQSSQNHELLRRRSARIRSSRKRSSTCLESPLPTSTDNLRRPRENQIRKKLVRECKEDSILDSEQLRTQHRSYKGLHNLGQTCYFNAIVQCLLHCPLFRNVIENVPQTALSVAVLRELRQLFNQMTRSNSLTHVSTGRCFSAAMAIPECGRAHMNKDKQEDAGEFFLILIEYFREKFQSLADIFEGNLRSIVRCQRCSSNYTTFQPFKLLALSFPTPHNELDPYNVSSTHDIYNLLDDYVSSEIISGYHCTQCATRQPAEKTLDLLSTPKVLVIQIKRFNDLQKIDDTVKFPSQLRLKYVSAGSQKHHSYRITGVVFHRGPTIASGHYISYVYTDGKWLEADDSSIREVPWEMVRNMKVYLLFYIRL